MRVPFPSPPWTLTGTAWVSLLPVLTGTPERPAGLYAAAFVDYRDPGTLAYRELVVGRVVGDPGRALLPRIEVTDAWVTSPTSRDGGRSLWAIPKELADLHLRERRLGPAGQATWDAGVDGEPLAAARFVAASTPVPRTPWRLALRQPADDGTTVPVAVSGAGATAPCLGRWDFGADGPLSWLRGRRPTLSLRTAGFRMRVGAG